MKYKLVLALCLLVPVCVQARAPEFSGKFYPADRAELATVVDDALAAAPAKKPAGRIVAVLAPHAAYVYSGKVAAHAYKIIESSYDTVVILSAGHVAGVKGAALLASGFYETPLGRVEIDEVLSRALIKANPLFEDNAAAHYGEHAVEVQLPFLQWKLKKPFKLVAATMNSDEPGKLKAMGAALAIALKGKKALIVISTDLSHYPAHAEAALADSTMLKAIETMDPEFVLNTARILAAKKIPGLVTCACGGAALAAGMEAARLLGARSFKPLKYADSYDENPQQSDVERVVGYLSGAFITGVEKPAAQASAVQKSLLLKEARYTIETALAGKEIFSGLEQDAWFNLPGAVFVTLTVNGALRGCIGTVEPVLTLMDAVRHGAYSAALRDQRFTPVTASELEKIKIEVSLLSRLSPIKAADIKPGRHGIVLANGGKSGLFLPQVWEQIPGKEDFLGELCAQKAGLPRDCWKDPATELKSFTVDAFKE